MPIMSSSIRKLSTAVLNGRTRPVRVLVLGQSAVGKTALTVRFVTKRFIGEYDPTLEQKYSCSADIDGETGHFEVLDTAGQDEDTMRWEENIKWADAFILIYSITDSVSFGECTRYKFLINHIKRKRKISVGALAQSQDIPVILVGNQTDLKYDRMVPRDEAERRSKELGCTHFYEISVRESYQDVHKIFESIYKDIRVLKKSPHLNRKSPPSSPPENRERAHNMVSEGGCGVQSQVHPTKKLLRRSTTAKIKSKMLPLFSSDNKKEFKRTKSVDNFFG